MEAKNGNRDFGMEQVKSESKDYRPQSDSDESDEDFCPEKEVNVPSECESSGDTESETEECQTNKRKSTKGRKNTSSTKRAKTQKLKNKDECDTDSDNDNPESTRRNTRFMDPAKNGNSKSVLEKDELPSDEETDKSRTDALWADFLNDVRPTQPAIIKSSEKERKVEKLNETKPADSKSASEAPKKITIEEVLDFAGEEVKVQKTISVDNIKENKTTSPAAASGKRLAGRSPGMSLKRPVSETGATTGVSTLLSQIGKKKKISVLEKTKLDWNSFKQNEGIDEELQTFNKGKDGFLERQDFLQRTDLRQFEIEKNLRQSRRTN